VSAMIDEIGTQVLKGVSRSFYLSLRLLPAPMRGAASLGYLLARTSDTLADTASLPIEDRRAALHQFDDCVAGDSSFVAWSPALVNAIPDARERHLLVDGPQILKGLAQLPREQAQLVREVVRTIIGGQSLDLERFATASKSAPVALADDAALEDYAWRVAGCVGEFWTKLGFLTLGKRFSQAPLDLMLGWGSSYGKGLQLVNILRDLEEDLENGRCYLPVENPLDSVELLAVHARWLPRAAAWLSEGERYAERLRSRRLRAGTLLPALLGKRTLEPLRGLTWDRLQVRLKIPRTAVYACLIQAMLKNASDPAI
jgi:farnesyl-diphosphate farnesyltransferase